MSGAGSLFLSGPDRGPKPPEAPADKEALNGVEVRGPIPEGTPSGSAPSEAPRAPSQRLGINSRPTPGHPAPLFEVTSAGGRVRFFVVLSRGGQLRLVERDAMRENGRAVRIFAYDLNALRALPELERFEGAARIYHEKRIARRARQVARECGGPNGHTATTD
jgi:hypothetical protein